MHKFIALFVISAVSLKAEMQFAGFFITPRESLYALTDTEDNISSGWLKVGQSFRGYSLESFDREHEMLTLKKDGGFYNLPLRESKVKGGKMTIEGLLTLGPDQQDEAVDASLFIGEENVFPLKDGLILHLTVRRMPDGNIMYLPRFSIQDKDGKEISEDFPGVVARPDGRFSIRNGDLGFSFKP